MNGSKATKIQADFRKSDIRNLAIEYSIFNLQMFGDPSSELGETAEDISISGDQLAFPVGYVRQRTETIDLQLAFTIFSFDSRVPCCNTEALFGKQGTRLPPRSRFTEVTVSYSPPTPSNTKMRGTYFVPRTVFNLHPEA